MGLEPVNLAAFAAVIPALDARRRDGVAYHRDTVTFHLRNSEAWGNRATGTDLAVQVDRDQRLF